MGDIGDYWRDVKPILKREAAECREKNYEASDGVSEQAIQLACQHGMRLKECNDGTQYNLSHPTGWVIQFYPGNGRIYGSGKCKAPFIRLNPETTTHTILDVVKAAIDALKVEEIMEARDQ